MQISNYLTDCHGVVNLGILRGSLRIRGLSTRTMQGGGVNPVYSIATRRWKWYDSVVKAPVVKWISRRPPEPEAGVRVPSGAPKFINPHFARDCGFFCFLYNPRHPHFHRHERTLRFPAFHNALRRATSYWVIISLEKGHRYSILLPSRS